MHVLKDTGNNQSAGRWVIQNSHTVGAQKETEPGGRPEQVARMLRPLVSHPPHSHGPKAPWAPDPHRTGTCPFTASESGTDNRFKA